MIKRSVEALRADILVALRDSERLIRSELERKANVCTTHQLDWLLMNKYVRSYKEGRCVFFEITDDGCELINQLSDKSFSRIYKISFIKEHWRNMTDENIARALRVSVKTVCRIRYELGLFKPGGYAR
jgi:hypothetical protein